MDASFTWMLFFYAAVAGPKDEDPKMEKESVGDRIANGATRSEGAGSKLR